MCGLGALTCRFLFIDETRPEGPAPAAVRPDVHCTINYSADHLVILSAWIWDTGIYLIAQTWCINNSWDREKELRSEHTLTAIGTALPGFFRNVPL
ncbi:hypothetical protein J6590_009121 [Homalodisca vitripennis]|nr:hypothetical protein J6590_009121 [Homalodisca vitripennis]